MAFPLHSSQMLLAFESYWFFRTDRLSLADLSLAQDPERSETLLFSATGGGKSWAAD